MEHTKGELEIMPYTRRDGHNIRWVKDKKGKAICQTFKPRAEANAERLVLCWNAHDKLVEFYKMMKGRHLSAFPEGGEYCVVCKQIKAIDEAISKAKPDSAE